MSIYLRWRKYKNGTESAYLEINENGKRRKKYIDVKIKKSDTDRREKRAKAKAIKIKFHEAYLNRQWGLVDLEKVNTPILEYCSNFLENYDKAGKRKYKAAVSSFISFLKSKGFSQTLSCKEVTPSLCESFKDYLTDESHFQGETPYDYFKRFTAILNKATRERFFIDNPMKEIKFSKPETDVNKQILTIDEIQILINTKYGNPEVRRAFLFACFTGLGEKEIRNLKWENVADGRLNIRRAKNNQKVSFKLSETALKILGEYGKFQDHVFDLPSNSRVWRILQKWMDKAGIEKHISFYCARHSFAVMNLKNNTNLRVIRDLMGHKTMEHTVKYLNFLDDQKDKAMDELPDIEI